MSIVVIIEKGRRGAAGRGRDGDPARGAAAGKYLVDCMCVYIYIYIYIYIERERDRYVYIYIYIYTY